MQLEFVKYEGAGNDFVICDMQNSYLELSRSQIAFLCHRRFGIGADGYMTLSNDKESDFYMRYYNSDGGESTMCGNGGRCIAHYAHGLGLGSGSIVTFNAIDGAHSASIDNSEVRLKMIDFERAKECGKGRLIFTGSPHYVEVVESVDALDLTKVAVPIRKLYDCNVNFVEMIDDGIKIRTFERGVEDETYACGTGAVACAVVCDSNRVIVKGGELFVEYTKSLNGYKDVFLTGPAKKVYCGTIEI